MGWRKFALEVVRGKGGSTQSLSNCDSKIGQICEREFVTRLRLEADSLLRSEGSYLVLTMAKMNPALADAHTSKTKRYEMRGLGQSLSSAQVS